MRIHRPSVYLSEMKALAHMPAAYLALSQQYELLSSKEAVFYRRCECFDGRR